MFISDAYAQTAAGAAGAGDPTMALIMQLAPFVLMFGVFYFLIMRPQQQQRKKLQDAINALKKGDVIVTSGGLIGKVRSVADDELRVELGPNVEVRLMRYAVGEVRSKTEPAPANDSKSASAS
ncbi:MAG TPA: preprotein translocase subunit YajC [Vitreimonas sp.]|jgi:preprotein translocase subunit YajC|nr:preprotein translocase subunit YajC [Vitreimonas sp.]